MGDGFFLLIFLADAIVMVVPADTLMAITLLVVPQKKREWCIAGLVGAMLGYLILIILTQTTFRPEIIHYLSTSDFTRDSFNEILSGPSKFGYFNLIVGSLTVIPQNVCVVGGIIIGLNAFLVLFLAGLIKLGRILVVILLVKQAVKTGLFLKDKLKLKDYWIIISSIWKKSSRENEAQTKVEKEIFGEDGGGK